MQVVRQTAVSYQLNQISSVSNFKRHLYCHVISISGIYGMNAMVGAQPNAFFQLLFYDFIRYRFFRLRSLHRLYTPSFSVMFIGLLLNKMSPVVVLSPQRDYLLLRCTYILLYFSAVPLWQRARF